MNIIIIISIFSYLMGSIPFGLILPKIFGYGDVRSIGSGNIGATNVMRLNNKKLGISVFILDMLKGLFPVALATYLTQDELVIASSFFLSVIGHIFPLWLKFKGGKGVATLIGGLIIVNYSLAIIFILVWILTFNIFKTSSISSITSNISMILFCYIFESNIYIISAIVINVILVIIRHKDNIKRIINKEENIFKKNDK